MDAALMESQIKSDVEKLAVEFPQTQDLYREVAGLLFFRYGITPTGNRLYQLVHRGSMSAPATALERFWENLRSKCKVTLNAPDLPADLATTAGEMVAGLWRRAQTEATENFAESRSEFTTEIQRLQLDLAKMAETESQLKQDLEDSHRSWQSAQERGEQLAGELASARAHQSALTVQVEDLGNQVRSLENIIVDSRRAHSKELEAARQSVSNAEERCRAIEAAGRQEIERERSINLKLQGEIEALRSASLVEAEKHHQAIANLQMQAGETQKTLAVSEGLLDQFRSDNKTLVDRVDSLRSEITQKEIRIGLLSHDLEQKDKELAAAMKEAEALRKKKPTSESHRKK